MHPNLSSLKSAILQEEIFLYSCKLTILLRILVRFLAPVFKGYAGNPFFRSGSRRSINLVVYMLKLMEQLAVGCPRMMFLSNGVLK